MRKIIFYITAIGCLCFVTEAKAQQAPVLMSLEQKLNSLNAQQKEAFEKLKSATPSMLSFYDEDETIRDIRDNPKVQVVELHDITMLGKLQDSKHAADFESTKLLMIRLQDADKGAIRADDLRLFKGLRYILLKSYAPIEDAQGRKLVQDILQNEEALSGVEIYYTFIGSEE